MTEQDELERRVRASLAARADEVDTTVPLTFGGTPHRRRWLVVGAVAVAAAVVVAVAVPVVVLDGPEPKQARPLPADHTPTPSPAPAQWRTEYWHGVSVEVPARWEWGAAPMDLAGDTSRCGGPYDGTPYVGRPVFQSDMCMGGTLPAPTGPYVWFDAQGVEPGTVDLADGYVQETVETDGTTVTVGSDDPAVRERIVSSVRTQDLCPPTVPTDGPDVGGMPTEGVGDVRTFTLCAYTRSELVYGADLGVVAYARWQRALPENLGSDVTTGCPSHNDRVVLAGTFDDPFGTEPIPLTWAVDVACNTVSSPYGEDVSTPAMTRVWEQPALRSILPTLIGPMG